MRKRMNTLKLPPIRPEGKNVLAKVSGEPYIKTLGVPKDYVRLTPEVDYIVEQIKGEELERLLFRSRKQAESSLEELVHQWKALEQKELVFQRTIMAHNRFLRRNLEKRERASLKIQNDMELNKKRSRDIKLLSQKYDTLKQVLVMMRNEIEKHSIYQNYLDLVMEEANCPFKILFEFLSKFEILLEIKEYCMNRQNKEMSSTVRLQGANIRHSRNQKVSFIGFKNELNSLTVRYDETIRRNLASETLLQNIIIKSIDIRNDVMACQFMIDTIYRYMCHRKGISPGMLELRDIQPKIDEIKHTLAGYAKLMPCLQRRRRSRDYRKSLTLRRLSVPRDEVVNVKEVISGTSRRQSNITDISGNTVRSEGGIPE